MVARSLHHLRPWRRKVRPCGRLRRPASNWSGFPLWSIRATEARASRPSSSRRLGTPLRPRVVRRLHPRSSRGIPAIGPAAACAGPQVPAQGRHFRWSRCSEPPRAVDPETESDCVPCDRCSGCSSALESSSATGMIDSGVPVLRLMVKMPQIRRLRRPQDPQDRSASDNDALKLDSWILLRTPQRYNEAS